MFLFRASPTENIVSVSRAVIFATTAATALFFLFVIGFGVRAQRLKPVTGISVLIGKKGDAINLLNPEGMIKVNGEMWNAVSLSGIINPGENIIVKEIKNLTLYVERS